MRRRRAILQCLLFVGITPCLASLSAAEPTARGIEFFEANIRPVLVKQCYKCHSAEAKKLKGKLRLDTADGVLKGGSSGAAVVPGKPDESLLLTTLRYELEGLKMPPSGKLDEATIANFAKWIEMGAPDPRVATAAAPKGGASASTAIQEQAKSHWAFQPLRQSHVPTVAAADWPRADLDRFVLAKLEGNDLHPNADADEAALLRRVFFDLIGLPPTPEELHAFLADDSGDAYEAVVDILLASPSFGERWGRHWLDVARYGESTGREVNYVFPYAWRYRDYVIQSFNRDKPYDQFITEQLAGDLLPAETEEEFNEHRIATGFLTLATRGFEEKNVEQVKMDVIDDQIDVTCRAFLALTVNCARCHDHKFDPIPTADYYALAGIFGSTDVRSGCDSGGARTVNSSTLFLPLGRDTERFAKESDAYQKRVSDLQRTLTASRKALGALREPPAPAATASVEAAVSETQEQKSDESAKPAEDPAAKMAELAHTIADCETQLAELARHPPQPLQVNYVNAVRDLPQMSDCRIKVRGDPGVEGDLVPRGFLSLVKVDSLPSIPPETSGRLQLAQWLTRPDNPLTARVLVNRVWHHLFGQGLVAAVDNFGMVEEGPSHRELLDYLAAEFMNNGWSVKQLIRSIVLSRAYQLSSDPDNPAYAVDPDNRSIWRMSPRRLEAEAIRDSLLAFSGQLDLVPPLGSGLSDFDDGKIFRIVQTGTKEALAAFPTKRSVYLTMARSFVPEVLKVFDAADPSFVMGRREVTTTPAQALFMLNSPLIKEHAQNAAARFLARDLPDESARVTLAYETAYGRAPTETELGKTLNFLNEYQQAGQSDLDAWAALCHMLIASGEFRYLR